MARRLNSPPIRPIPITPSVLLYSSTPSKFFLSQFFPRMFASACGILRATESNNENACSAVERVFPPGALSTTMPRRVAASTSTLSTPTPARPTTRSFMPAFKIAAVIFVWLRTTSALNDGMSATSSRSPNPVLMVTSSARSRESSSTPRSEIGSEIRTFGEVICCRAGASPAGQPEQSLYSWLPSLSVNDQVNGVGQMLNHVCRNAAAEKLHHGRTLGGADDEEINAHRRGKIDDGRGSVLAYSVNRHHINAAFGSKFPHRAHDGVCFWIILPFGAAKPCACCCIVNGDLLNIEHKQCGFAQLRFVQRKSEYGRNTARGDHDFLAFLQARPHAGNQVRRNHLRHFACHRQSGEALPLQRVSAQRKAADQDREYKLERIELRVSQRQLDESQNYKRNAKEHTIVPGEIYVPIECAGAEVHGDRADYANCIKPGKSSKVCRKEKHDDGQGNGNDQRPYRDAVSVQLTKLPRHLAIARHHVKQADHSY